MRGALNSYSLRNTHKKNNKKIIIYKIFEFNIYDLINLYQSI